MREGGNVLTSKADLASDEDFVVNPFHKGGRWQILECWVRNLGLVLIVEFHGHAQTLCLEVLELHRRRADVCCVHNGL